MKHSGFKQKPRKPLKRTPLRRVGVTGKANIEANKILKKVLAEKTICEINLEGCLVGMYLTNAHRHKRAWYKGDVKLLSDYKQVIRACVNCHDRIEHNAELTEKVFIKLRGEE